MSRCSPGDYVEVDYSDDAVAHERLLVWPRGRGWWRVRSPDGDQWDEDLKCRDPNSGPLRCRPLRADGLALGLPRLYRFRERPDDAAFRTILAREVRRCGAAMLAGMSPPVVSVRRADGTLVDIVTFLGGPDDALVKVFFAGVPPTVGGGLLPGGHHGGELPVGIRYLRPDDFDDGGVWLLLSGGAGKVAGSEVTPNAGWDLLVGPKRALVQLRGTWCLAEQVDAADAPAFAAAARPGGEVVVDEAAEVGAEPRRRRRLEAALGLASAEAAEAPQDEAGTASDDMRTLWVDWDSHGEKYKPWREVVRESYTDGDLRPHLDGGATALHMCKVMEKQGGDPRLWLERWLREKHIESTDRVAHELRSIVDALYHAGSTDQLNVGGLVSLEVLCRRIALIVEAYAAPGKPSWEHARYYSGVASAEEVIAPALRSFVHRKAREDYELNSARSRGVPRTSAGSADGGGAMEEDGAQKGRGAGRGRGKGGPKALPPAST